LEFQTADRAVERATADYCLCVGVANEPRFQKQQKIDAKYRRRHERRQFAFDAGPHETASSPPAKTGAIGPRAWTTVAGRLPS